MLIRFSRGVLSTKRNAPRRFPIRFRQDYFSPEAALGRFLPFRILPPQWLLSGPAIQIVSGNAIVQCMLIESDVIAAVCDYLRAEGYEIRQQLAETEQGDDIKAVQGTAILLIEAKGETSSKKGSKRFGKPFSRSQVLDHVAMAFYRAAKMRGDGVRVAMAFPDNQQHREMVAEIRQAVRDLKIAVFWVAGNGSVRESG